jgi:hypothetical protein
MSDLTDIQAAQSVKVVGANSTGTEQVPVESAVDPNGKGRLLVDAISKLTDGTNTVLVTPLGDLEVSDGLSNGGVNGNLVLTTANTAYEAKVGASRLTNRKSLTIQAVDFDVYWGYSSGVTVANGTLLNKGQFIVFACDPNSTFQVWLVCANSSKNVRIAESP